MGLHYGSDELSCNYCYRSATVRRPVGVEAVKVLRHRIAWILEAKNLSARGWGKKSGVSGPYITMLAQGKRGGRGLTPETAKKLAESAGISLTWLLTGEGDPEPGVSAPEALEDLPPALEQALMLLGDRIAAPVRSALRAEKGGKTWSVDQWIDRARALQTSYDRVVKEFDKPTDN
jgi:transcriptional regulator with XRE-family HTH domain